MRVPWALLMAGLGGLATAGVVVGGAWVLNTTGTYIDRQPIDPPPRVGAYLRYDKLDVRASGRPDIQQKILEQNAKSSQLLSQAHGGAAAVVQLYAGRDLRQRQAQNAVQRARRETSGEAVFPVFAMTRNHFGSLFVRGDHLRHQRDRVLQIGRQLDDHVAGRITAPAMSPQIEHVVQVDVRQ